MKTFTLKKTSFVLLASLALLSCSKDKDPVQDPTKDGCADQKILLLNTEFGNDLNSDITYLQYDLDNVSQGAALILDTYTAPEDMRFKLPPNNSLFDPHQNIHGIFLHGKYYTHNLNTHITTEHNSGYTVAPVSISNAYYVIELSDPYPGSGSSVTFDIKTFNPQNGSTGTALPISTAEKTFTNNSLFHIEIISSTNNHTDEIYFLAGTNLLTINTVNNTASHIDLHPDFSQNDWVTFQGIEYTEDFGLIAIKRDNGNYSLVSIDPQTGTHSSLINIPEPINTEFYSTAYNECNQTFYLTTLHQPSGNNTLYYEFDLANSSIQAAETLPQYNYGLQIIEE